MESKKTSINLNLLAAGVEAHLLKIERLLPPTYKLTLLARCTNKDLADADILMTQDSLADIKEAVHKREAALHPSDHGH